MITSSYSSHGAEGKISLVCSEDFHSMLWFTGFCWEQQAGLRAGWEACGFWVACTYQAIWVHFPCQSPTVVVLPWEDQVRSKVGNLSPGGCWIGLPPTQLTLSPSEEVRPREHLCYLLCVSRFKNSFKLPVPMVHAFAFGRELLGSRKICEDFSLLFLCQLVSTK